MHLYNLRKGYRKTTHALASRTDIVPDFSVFIDFFLTILIFKYHIEYSINLGG